MIPTGGSRLLAAINRPNVAYILMLLGIYGSFLNFGIPVMYCQALSAASACCSRLRVPGVAHQLCGLGAHPARHAFMVAEAFLPSFGALWHRRRGWFVVGSIFSWTPTSRAIPSPGR